MLCITLYEFLRALSNLLKVNKSFVLFLSLIFITKSLMTIGVTVASKIANIINKPNVLANLPTTTIKIIAAYAVKRAIITFFISLIMLSFVREMVKKMTKKIVHIDLNAFFAQCEINKDKSLLGKPIAIGSMVKGELSQHQVMRQDVLAYIQANPWLKLDLYAKI